MQITEILDQEVQSQAEKYEFLPCPPHTPRCCRPALPCGPTPWSKRRCWRSGWCWSPCPPGGSGSAWSRSRGRPRPPQSCRLDRPTRCKQRRALTQLFTITASVRTGDALELSPTAGKCRLGNVGQTAAMDLDYNQQQSSFYEGCKRVQCLYFKCLYFKDLYSATSM